MLFLLKGESACLVKNKMACPKTKKYVMWVKEEVKRNLSLFDGYTKGYGIIASCKRFLEWLEMDEGKRVKKNTKTDKGAMQLPSKKSLVPPITIVSSQVHNPC